MRRVGIAEGGDMRGKGGEGNCPGKVGRGKAGGKGNRERLLAFQAPGLHRDLAEDRQRAADLSLSLTRAARGGGELLL